MFHPKCVNTGNPFPGSIKDLHRMTKRKARLHKKAKITNNWDTYKRYQKHCKKDFKKAEIDYINNTIQSGLDENNTKPFWRYVKSRRKDNTGVAPLKKIGSTYE
ncbi:hypothetical protein DPMN_001014 [Dreissena polymorpha]|uniref:Uncharacterized protein n=1 Tax=Dreissena polymorpha TaxID=45954 RepID=A0A9D4RSN9_DREPO|nr:hypothetical protein DPMN_001014 [Dreissena polymorpha]